MYIYFTLLTSKQLSIFLKKWFSYPIIPILLHLIREINRNIFYCLLLFNCLLFCTYTQIIPEVSSAVQMLPNQWF